MTLELANVILGFLHALSIGTWGIAMFVEVMGACSLNRIMILVAELVVIAFFITMEVMLMDKVKNKYYRRRK